MPEGPTISPEPPSQPVLDYARLRAEGIRHLQTLSGEIWTDHNTHDPGITILEALCYALTDLGYRTQTAVSALGASDDSGPVLPDSTVPQPADLLPCHPLTPADFRQVLLDWREEGTQLTKPARLRDAAIEPWFPNTGSSSASGIYRVALEFEDRDLNHFINVNRVDDQAGVIGGVLNGKEIASKDIMTIEDPGQAEANPFFVRTSEEDIEISFPRWHTLGPEWFEPAALTAVTPGEVKALPPVESNTYECQVAAKLGTKDVTFSVLVRVVSELDSATDVARAIQRAITSAAQDPKEPGTKNLFSRFKDAMERVGSLRGKIASYLESQRNLCEFFPSFAIGPMPVDELGVTALIRIDSGVEEMGVAQEFRRRIARIFSPQIHLRTPAQKVRDGMELPEAWEGPILKNFETQTEADRSMSAGDPPEDLCASDVIRMLMEIPGVRAVELTRLSLFTSGSEAEESIFALGDPAKGEPRQDVSKLIDAARRLRLSVLDSRTALSFQRVNEHGTLGEVTGPVVMKVQDDPPREPLLTDLNRDASEVEAFAWGALREYHSIEHELPSVYGLKAASISNQPAEIRSTQALQLRGYLAFYDQILANASAQLERTPQLLTSGEPEAQPNVPGGSVRRTWYTQALGKSLGPLAPDLEPLLMDGASTDDLARAGTTDYEALRLRAARLLDHLLARQGVISTLSESGKQTLLRGLPRDAMLRAAASTPSNPAVSGLQQRLARFAGSEVEDLFIIESMALALDRNTIPTDEEIRAAQFRLLIVANQTKFGGQRTQFEVLAQREAPAHLELEFLWCDPGTFTDLRTTFVAWYQPSRQSPGTDTPGGDQLTVLRTKLAKARENRS